MQVWMQKRYIMWSLWGLDHGYLHGIVMVDAASLMIENELDNPAVYFDKVEGGFAFQSDLAQGGGEGYGDQSYSLHNPSASSTKLERKTVERNRRMHMKGLSFKLLSLLPKHFLQEANCQEDQLHGASVYIKKLEEKGAELKGRRDLRRSKQERMSKPVVQVREFDSTLEVSLIDGMYIKFRFSDAISVLEEE